VVTISMKYSRNFRNIVQIGAARRSKYASAGLCVAVLFGSTGCNGLPSVSETATETPKNVPQTYMASVVGETNGVTSVLQAYSFDNRADTFQQATNQLQHGNPSQINNSGEFKPLARGLLELETTYSFPFGTAGTGTTYNPPQTGSWAVELPDNTGGLVQLQSQPVTPLGAGVCPGSTQAHTYQFLTVSNPLLVPAAGTPQPMLQTWNPALETAYGSVDISGGGSVTLANTQQSTFPSGGSSSAPSMAVAASATGLCSASIYGNTITVPGQLTVSNPGSGETVPASATIGVSASGLLVESNGANADTPYQNALGAGTGAVGLLKPSAALNTGTLAAAQYNGFIYGSGNASSPFNFSSTVASFGFASTPASCASVAAATSTLIYGGDFPNNDPSAAAVQSAGGFGNCDYAIDLGQQDASNNGYYPAATIYVGASFSGNTTGTAYSFPAIAIAGQLAGKNAIFVLGVDTAGSPNQAVGIYLLQSN